MEIVELQQYLIKLRREFHKYPEKGWTEYRTTARIGEILRKYGFEITYPILDKTNLLDFHTNIIQEKQRALNEGASHLELDKFNFPGVIAVIKTGKRGLNHGFRFDIDAVEINESKEKKHVPLKENFSSTHNNIHHACGHDGHTALGICLAIYLAEHINDYTGTYTFIFQPAEEGCRGANAICNHKLVQAIDQFYAFHLGICAQNHEIVIHPTNFLISTKFNVEIFGKSSHAGIAPDKGINALHCACQIADQLFKLRNERNSSRFNIGNFLSNNGRNAISDYVCFMAECRDVTSEFNDQLYSKAFEIIKNVCNKFGTTYKINIVGFTSQFENSKELEEKLCQSIESTDFKVINKANFNACEDCCHIINSIQKFGGKTCYFIIGNTISSGHHTDRFDLDENELQKSLILLLKLL